VTTSPSSTGEQPSAREQAFDLLAEIVSENYNHGRRSYGASLKPALVKRTMGGFSLEQLGFPGLRQFLESAQREGRVSLYAAPRGPDVEVAPVGAEPLPETPTERRSQRIRRDLWEAFINWDERLAHYYDKQSNEAIQFAHTPVPLEPSRYTELRRLVAEEPERFVEITPLSFDAQVSWMREFAEGLREGLDREHLLAAVSSNYPAREFARALNTRPAIRNQWSRFRQTRLEEVIGDWARGAGLAIEIHDRPSADGPHAEERESREPGDHSEAERLEHLRRRLHEAIDRMPEAELLQLRLPVEYLIDLR
jgi:hypothetical protein